MRFVVYISHHFEAKMPCSAPILSNLSYLAGVDVKVAS
jgi:hypothetical protein